MGFSCLVGNEIKYSFTYYDTEWEALKYDYLAPNILMPCCGHACIPKTSILGTKYFAHKAKA